MASPAIKILSASLCLGAAASAALTCRDKPPAVDVQNGTYTGVHSKEFQQDYFLGMPYAQPASRFNLAQPLNETWDQAREATSYPPHCVGFGEDMVGYDISEDCLYLNVVRPAGIDADADLPVAVWIHGGGLVGIAASSKPSCSDKWSLVHGWKRRQALQPLVHRPEQR
jgi:carboxylesterase type B